MNSHQLSVTSKQLSVSSYQSSVSSKQFKKISVNPENPVILSKIFLFMLFMSVMVNIYSEPAKFAININKNLFANTEYSFSITGKTTGNESLNWNISSLGRTIFAGSATIKEETTQIKFKTPNIKTGFIGKFQLSCYIKDISIKKDFYVFNKNPFALDNNKIESLGVCVYDITENNKVIEQLKTYNEKIKKTSNIEDFDGKVLVIIGLDFENNPGIEDVIFAECAKGRKIIFIAPVAGTISIANKNIKSIKMTGNEIIAEYNKKYDNNISITKFALSQVDYDTVLNFNNMQKSNFSYCEMKIGEGSIIFFGMDIFKNKDISPTEIYLLKDLIFNNIK